MSENTDFIQIGSIHCGGERNAPSHIAQLHVGHVAAWKLTNLEGDLTLPVRWWPNEPQRILPDLLAMIGIHVFSMRVTNPRLGGMEARPRKRDIRELDAIANRVKAMRGTLLTFHLSSSSSISFDDLRKLGNLSYEVVERTSAHFWDTGVADWISNPDGLSPESGWSS